MNTTAPETPVQPGLRFRLRSCPARFVRVCCGLVALATVSGAALRAAGSTAADQSAARPHLPGKFVWADLVTHDVVGARAFYGDLLGWQFREVGEYTIAENDGRPLAGIVHRPRPKDPAALPRWLGYMSVRDVGAARDAVNRAGGRVLAQPTQIPNRGEHAVFADREGAIFGAVKSSLGDPEDFLAEPGDWIWIQLMSRDGANAAKFYHAVGGYEVVENTVGGEWKDYVLASNGYARAAIRTIRSEDERIRPTWLPFVRVKSVRESVAKTKNLGGKILMEPTTSLFDGKLALIADPAGAAIGILEWPEAWTKGAE